MESVINRDSNDGFPNFDGLINDEGEVIALVASATVDVAASMYPEADGEFLVFIARWPDNVESEAVL